LTNDTFVNIHRALSQENHTDAMMPADAYPFPDDLLARTPLTFGNEQVRLINDGNVWGNETP
jgi:hypothetical protein